MISCGPSDWAFVTPLWLTLPLAVGILLLMLLVMQQRSIPGRDSFILLHIAVLGWLLVSSAEMASQSAACKQFWAGMAWPWIVGAPTTWAIFLWQYINSARQPLNLSTRLLLGLPPVLICVLALSNPDYLFYGELTAPASNEAGAGLIYQHGPLFYLAVTYNYLFMLFALGLVIRAVLVSHGLHRRHYLAFLALTTLPWLANGAYVLLGWTIFDFDPTPFSFVFTLAGFVWLVLGLRLFDLMPVARNLLLEQLPDPVLVIDPDLRVIEANPQALSLCGSPMRHWQGCELKDWPLFGAKLAALIERKDPEETLSLELNGIDYCFEVNRHSLLRQKRNGSVPLGEMLYLRDISLRIRSERKLAEALEVSEERLRIITDLHHQLQKRSLRDPLTGLFNRSYLQEFFARELARAEREGLPLALALIDLDHFKQVNDRFGHLVGDDLLRAVAQFLQESLRSSDALFRFGGEEFLLIMPGATTRLARERLENICRALAATSLATRGGDQQITLSAGLVVWPELVGELEQLLAVADVALYEAKHGGRNRVCVARSNNL
jgi:diguanylate cyclase (GGDEF)-like protein